MYLIKGHARLFIFKNLSSISTNFHVVKYFFHPTRSFIYYIKRQGFATLPVYSILPLYSILQSTYLPFLYNFSDEAYLNLTDYLLKHPSIQPAEVVNEMRAKIEEKTTLTASAGISRNSLVSKICSDLNKPNGQYQLLCDDEIRKFVAQLPIRKVGGIGNVTEQLLQVLGVEKCQVRLSVSTESCVRFR